jgi:hypothetical protein
MAMFLLWAWSLLRLDGPDEWIVALRGPVGEAKPEIAPGKQGETPVMMRRKDDTWPNVPN